MSKFNALALIAVASTVSAAALAAPPLFATLDGPRDSALFAGKYEGNVLPHNAGLGFVLIDPNGIVGTGADPSLLSSESGVDFLKLDTDTNSTVNDVYGWKKDDGGTWNPDSNSALGGYTLEIRARVRANNHGTYGFAIRATDVNTDEYLQIFQNRVTDAGSVITSIPTESNSDTWHTFRFASYAPSNTSDPGTQIFKVWRDGLEIGDLPEFRSFPNPGNQLWFGDWISGNPEVNLDIDYLRWDTTGAWAPVPVPEPTSLALLALGSALCIRRGRRS